MAQKIDQRIESLEQRLKQLKARKQRSDSRRRASDSRRSRQEETRRKILVGAIVLAKVEQGVLEKELLWHWLDNALIRQDDRALFDLASDEQSKDGSMGESGPVEGNPTSAVASPSQDS